MNEPDILIINGHSRTADNYDVIIENMLSGADYEIIRLPDYDISYFDYEHKNIDDDFIPIAQKMSSAKILVFVTPVYWYSMSGIMKVFFDRFTDLITVRKELGRLLEGKKCYVISCGYDDKCPESFDEPFKLTFKYLNMDYEGSFYYSTREDKALNTDRMREAGLFGDDVKRFLS